MEATIGVKGGSVNLFAILNDKDKKVSLVIDHTLLNNYDYIGFHPMQNDFTTSIKKDDLKKIIKQSEHEALDLDFTTLEGAGAPTE
jgi:Ala-tRNA(Pro) deacylase